MTLDAGLTAARVSHGRNRSSLAMRPGLLEWLTVGGRSTLVLAIGQPTTVDVLMGHAVHRQSMSSLAGFARPPQTERSRALRATAPVDQ